MRTMAGKALRMLFQGWGRDPQAVMAGVLVLAYGLDLRAVVLLRWGDANEGTRLLRVGDDYLPLTPVVLNVLHDYGERMQGTDCGLMFADVDGRTVRVRELAGRISDLTGDWFPVDTMRHWARKACPMLLAGAEIRRVLDDFTAMGANAKQRQRLEAELVAQLRAAVEEWHGYLASFDDTDFTD